MGLAQEKLQTETEVPSLNQCSLGTNRIVHMFRRIKQKFVSLGEGFRFAVERPIASEVCSDKILVSGWAASYDNTPVQVKILINDSYTKVISCTRQRLDVASALGLDNKTLGFECSLSWEEIGVDIDEVSLSVQFVHGKQVGVIGPFCIRRNLGREDQKFIFCIERPSNNEIVSGDIEISGWAFALDGKPVYGTVNVDGHTDTKLEFNQPRPDVGNVYNISCDSKPFGFKKLIAWSDLESDVSEVRLELTLEHGGDFFVFGPYRVVKTGASQLRHQRGSFSEVWDGASVDKISAFSSVAGTSDTKEFFLSGESTAQTLYEALDINYNDVVLEIGCGVARIGKFLAPRCRKWIGSDISANMLRYANETMKGVSNFELCKLDSCKLTPFEDGSVDKLYCSTVFMHLDEWDRYSYVLEAFRVLRSKGRCYFDNINLAGDGGWAVFEDISRIDSAQRSAAVSKASTAEELKTYLLRAGFEVGLIRLEPLYVSVVGVKP